jgi:hypothetical protein
MSNDGLSDLMRTPGEFAIEHVQQKLALTRSPLKLGRSEDAIDEFAALLIRRLKVLLRIDLWR